MCALKRPYGGCEIKHECATSHKIASDPGASSELRVHAHSKYRHRTAVSVVSRVGDELVVECNASGGGKSVAVVCLYDPFCPRIGQLAVADQDSQTSKVEKLLLDAGDAVDRSGNADVVTLPPP